jgi:tRNA (guanine37-N1)-methyltransferase
MLMKVEPLTKAILAAKAMAAERAVEHGSDRLLKVVYLSPQGRKLNQQMLVAAADTVDDLILIAGRYEGIDERIIQSLVDEEWSIGDYVISGGEFAALIIVDAVSRLLPGVLGDDESAQQDSFMQGLLDCPHYTRPEVIDDMAVPSVLLSGDHQAIRRWRLKQSLGRTWLRRPDLLEAAMNDADLWDEEKTNLLAEFKAEHRP